MNCFEGNAKENAELMAAMNNTLIGQTAVINNKIGGLTKNHLEGITGQITASIEMLCDSRDVATLCAMCPYPRLILFLSCRCKIASPSYFRRVDKKRFVCLRWFAASRWCICV